MIQQITLTKCIRSVTATEVYGKNDVHKVHQKNLVEPKTEMTTAAEPLEKFREEV
jgi:hypothetical protein